MTTGSGPGMLSSVQFDRFLLARLAPLLCVSVVACDSGTETGNPSFQARLSYTAYSSSPLRVAVGGPAQRASVSAVWLVLGDVDFMTSPACGGTEGAAYSAPGLGIGDHAAGGPTTTAFELAEGSYCNVSLPLLRYGQDLPDRAPVALRNRSIDIEGTLADGTPFSIVSGTTIVLELVADAGFRMHPEQGQALIGFDVAPWIESIDFSRAEAPDGVIEISAEQNASLLMQFEAALPNGVSLFRDDGDGVLDPEAEVLAQGAPVR